MLTSRRGFALLFVSLASGLACGGEQMPSAPDASNWVNPIYQRLQGSWETPEVSLCFQGEDLVSIVSTETENLQTLSVHWRPLSTVSGVIDWGIRSWMSYRVTFQLDDDTLAVKAKPRRSACEDMGPSGPPCYPSIGYELSLQGDCSHPDSP